MKIIAVCCGKGGVGKSSFSALISTYFSEKGKTLLLDFDLCGPSLSFAFGVKEKVVAAKKGFKPIKIANNLDILSFGSILKKEDALIWRGPKKLIFLQKFIDSTDNYDYVIIDTPPGISEEHEFLSDKLDEVIIVTTPQNIALNDAQNCIEFFQSKNIKIGGVIENMSFMTCKCCDYKYSPFGSMGGKNLAIEYNLKFLGHFEIEPDFAYAMDSSNFYFLAKSLKSYSKIKELL